MTRVPREIRYDHKEPMCIYLYKDEIELIGGLVQREIHDCEKQIEDVRKDVSAAPIAKVIAAYNDIIEDYKELLDVLSGGL